jgi:excisionase family DNA binding protein
MEKEPRQDILTPTEAAVLLRCHWRTVVRYAERGIVPGRKLGTMWRFSRERLVEFIKQDEQK